MWMPSGTAMVLAITYPKLGALHWNQLRAPFLIWFVSKLTPSAVDMLLTCLMAIRKIYSADCANIVCSLCTVHSSKSLYTKSIDWSTAHGRWYWENSIQLTTVGVWGKTKFEKIKSEIVYSSRFILVAVGSVAALCPHASSERRWCEMWPQRKRQSILLCLCRFDKV